MKQSNIYIHSARMAGWIMFNGIMYTSVIRNKKHDSKNVYIFPKNQRISDVMESIPSK